MGKPKAQTLQQRFGFSDPELSTPKHDEMMLWLDENSERFINELLYEDDWPKTSIPQYDRFYEWKDDYEEIQLDELSLPEKPVRPRYRVTSKIWEHPITTQQSRGYGNKYTVGFIDMRIDFEVPFLNVVGLRQYEQCLYRKKGVYPTWKIEWLDWLGHNDPCILFVEVKPKITSLGELIRQIRHYETYAGNKFVVMCPDNRFQAALESQGIRFYRYTEGTS